MHTYFWFHTQLFRNRPGWHPSMFCLGRIKYACSGLRWEFCQLSCWKRRTSHSWRVVWKHTQIRIVHLFWCFRMRVVLPLRNIVSLCQKYNLSHRWSFCRYCTLKWMCVLPEVVSSFGRRYSSTTSEVLSHCMPNGNGACVGRLNHSAGGGGNHY